MFYSQYFCHTAFWPASSNSRFSTLNLLPLQTSIVADPSSLSSTPSPAAAAVAAMSGEGKTVFVTGGGGYVGSHCIVELLNEGFDVIAVDNFVNSIRGEEV